MQQFIQLKTCSYNMGTCSILDFFQRLKYQFLSGIRNRRQDDLIHVPQEKIIS